MKSERHIMLDIETLGNGPNALIITIGACEFFPGREDAPLGDTLYLEVDAEDAARHGGIMDVSTILWWLKQSEAARSALTEECPRWMLSEALNELRAFVAGDPTGKLLPPETAGVWGNGATFDNVILHSAARACKQPPLWSFRLDRDMRTIVWLEKALNLNVPIPAPVGVGHHALDDAVWQATRVYGILKSLKLENPNAPDKIPTPCP